MKVKNKVKLKTVLLIALFSILVVNQIDNARSVLYVSTQFTNYESTINNDEFESEIELPEGIDEQNVRDCQLPYNYDEVLDDCNNYENQSNYNRFDNVIDWGTKNNPNLNDFQIISTNNFVNISDFKNHKNCLKVNDISSSNSISIRYQNENSISNISFYFSFSVGTKLNDITITDDSGKVCFFASLNFLPQFGISIYNSTTRVEDCIESLSIDTFYLIYIIFDDITKTFDCFLDGKIIANNFNYYNINSNHDKLIISSHVSQNNYIYYYDSICVNSFYQNSNQSTYSIQSNDDYSYLEVENSSKIEFNTTNYENDIHVSISNLMQLQNDSLFELNMYNNESSKINCEFDLKTGKIASINEFDLLVSNNSYGLYGNFTWLNQNYVGNKITMLFNGSLGSANLFNLTIDDNNVDFYSSTDYGLTWYNWGAVFVSDVDSYDYSLITVRNNNDDGFGIYYDDLLIIEWPVWINITYIWVQNFELNLDSYDDLLVDINCYDNLTIQIDFNEYSLFFDNIFIDDFSIDFIILSQFNINMLGFDSNCKMYYSGLINCSLVDEDYVKTIENLYDSNLGYDSFEYEENTFFNSRSIDNVNYWQDSIYVLSNNTNKFKHKINVVSNVLHSAITENEAGSNLLNSYFYMKDISNYNKNYFSMSIFLNKTVNSSIDFMFNNAHITFFVNSSTMVSVFWWYVSDIYPYNTYYYHVDTIVFENEIDDYLYISLFRTFLVYEDSMFDPFFDYFGYKVGFNNEIKFGFYDLTSYLGGIFDETNVQIFVFNFRWSDALTTDNIGIFAVSFEDTVSVYDFLRMYAFHLTSIEITDDLYNYDYYLPFKYQYRSRVYIENYLQDFSYESSDYLSNYMDENNLEISYVNVVNVWLNSTVSYFQNSYLLNSSYLFVGLNSSLFLDSDVNIDGNILQIDDTEVHDRKWSQETPSYLYGYRYDYFFEYKQNSDFEIDINANHSIIYYDDYSDSLSVRYCFLIGYFIYLIPEGLELSDFGINAILPMVLIFLFPFLFYRVMGKKSIALGLFIGFIFLGFSGFISTVYSLILSVMSALLGVYLYKKDREDTIISERGGAI